MTNGSWHKNTPASSALEWCNFGASSKEPLTLEILAQCLLLGLLKTVKEDDTCCDKKLNRKIG